MECFVSISPLIYRIYQCLRGVTIDPLPNIVLIIQLEVKTRLSSIVSKPIKVVVVFVVIVVVFVKKKIGMKIFDPKVINV